MTRLLRWFRYQRDAQATAPDMGAVAACEMSPEEFRAVAAAEIAKLKQAATVAEPTIDDLFGEFWSLDYEDLMTARDWRRRVAFAYARGYKAACRDAGVEWDTDYDMSNGWMPIYKAKAPA